MLLITSPGELETTITKSFQYASALRRWVTRFDQPAAVSAINNLLERSFPASEGDIQGDNHLAPSPEDIMEVDDETDDSPNTHVRDFIHTQSSRSSVKEILFRKRVRQNGVMLSIQDSHRGNSWIEFYGNDARHTNDTAVGSIMKIALTEQGTFLVIRRLKPLPISAIDPFQEFIDFPGKMYLAELEGESLLIEAKKFKNHIAYYETSDGKAVVVSLSRY